MTGAIIGQIKSIIQYRHLLWDLALKDLKVRYRTPALGFLWAVIGPLITVFIFKLVFSTILNVEIENYPFFIYLMTAIFPWAYFSSSVSGAVDSISNNRELVRKTYFPRQIIPISIVLANLINFIPAFIVMFLFLILFKMQLTILIFWVPLIILLQTIFTIGLALIFSSLQVILQDVRYISEIILMAWLYLSPGFYSLTIIADISDRFFKLYSLNPFVGFFSFYRIALLKGYAQTLPAQTNIPFLIIFTIAVSFITFFLGFIIFKKYEPRFSDLI